MEILRVTLTPEELRASAELQEVLRVGGTSIADAGLTRDTSEGISAAFSSEVATLLSRAPAVDRDRIERFAREALGIGDVELVPGRKRDTGKMTGYVRLVKAGVPYGTFAYLFPRRRVMNLRLPRERADDYRNAWRRGDSKSERPFQVAIRLTSDAAIDEAIRIAKEAYESI